MCSILEDPRNCRLTGPGSPDMKAQLSHRSEVFSSIRCARSCRSPIYSSTVSPGRKWHVSNATKGSGAKAMRRACFTCCKSSLWSRVNRRYTDRAPPLSLSGRICSTLSTLHISHTSSTCSNHSDTVWSDETPWNSRISRMSNALPAICIWLHMRRNSLFEVWRSSRSGINLLGGSQIIQQYYILYLNILIVLLGVVPHSGFTGFITALYIHIHIYIFRRWTKVIRQIGIFLLCYIWLYIIFQIKLLTRFLSFFV